MRKNTVIYNVVKDKYWCNLLTGYVKSLVDATCCPKVSYEESKYGAGTNIFVPKFTS